MMLASQLCILRVFGLPAADVSAAVRAAEAEGCPGLRLLERDGEFAVCVQVSAPTQAMADEYCEKWAQKLRARLGDAVYGTGEISLAQATLTALLDKRRLLVAADEVTGRLVGALLQPLEHSEAAYDFGNQTWADPAGARKIVTPPALLQKFPGDVLQAAAGRAQLALAMAGADYAVVYLPATVGQAPSVVLCDKRGAVAQAVGPDLSDAAIANHLLDLVRRRALGLKPSPAAITFRPGHERPLLLVSQEGQPRAEVPRASVRRRPVRPAQPPRAPSADGQPTGAIVFEQDGQETPPAAAPRPTRPDRDEEDTFAPLPDPLNFETAGAKAAAESRAARTAPAARAAAPSAPGGEPDAPAHSLLDEEIPDFSAGLDPAAIQAAMEEDAKSPPRSAEEFEKAATLLFDKVQPDPPRETPRPHRADAPARPAGSPAAAPRRAPQDAASLKNRSLAVIERSERRRRRHALVTALAVLAVLAAGGLGVWFFLRNDLGARPAPRNYGTAIFDDTVANYLDNAIRKLDGVAGYLAFPGQAGRFVYNAGELPVQDGQAAGAEFATDNWLGSDTPSNTVLTVQDGLTVFETAEGVQQNNGFTLYLPDSAYRCKVVAVYYLDSADETALEPIQYTDLSDYYRYLEFVLGIGARSLYDTGNDAADGETFVTLVGPSGTEGVQVCVTGCVVGAQEDPTLSAQVQTNESALLPASMYEVTGRQAPEPGTALGDQMSRYTALTAARAGSGQGSGSAQTAGGSTDTTTTALDAELDELTQQTQDLIASTDDLLAGLSDIAGQSGAVETDINQGAEGSLPTQSVKVDDLTSATPAPTQAPTEAPAEEGGDSGGTEATPAPTEAPAPAPSETINVTMNGTAQSMDLVTCLAMIAQNELGSNAPAEAYKAQCVAAHCWILSQGGYPSVSGATPGSAALAAAQEVARVLVTYNGEVCFTPYFASASTGTASAADVWGSNIPYLQAVDSPYDQTTASNWNTNGYNTGCARFSRQTLQDRILEKMGVDLSGVDPNSWFTILSTNQYGWVTQMQIGPNASGNDTCSGRWFRETLTAGCSVDGRSLRSHCFTVSYDASLDCFIFDVKGYGHGCGMSQWGAVGYANNGWSYQDILAHYYPGTTLTTY